MRKIEILKPLFLGLFIVLMLFACEKETVNKNKQQEINKPDKAFENENWIISTTTSTFVGGTITIVEGAFGGYVDVDLLENYSFKDFYVFADGFEVTESSINNYIKIPVNINMECDVDSYKYLFFEVCEDSEINDPILNLRLMGWYSPKYGPSYPLRPPHWLNCVALSFDELIPEPTFDLYRANLNYDINGSCVYLQKETFSEGRLSIKNIRIAYSFYDDEALSFVDNDVYTNHTGVGFHLDPTAINMYLGFIERRTY